MRIGEVFNNSKWDIIKDLTNQKYSPLQLAQKHNTTIGNVGHQLRILEAYGLVKKEKIPNRNKGKPRTLFSLAHDCAYLVSASKGFAQKKFLKLSSHHDTILKLWFIEDSKFHYPLEKFYWKIEDHIDDIKGFALKVTGPDSVNVLILTSNPKIRKKIDSTMKINDRQGGFISFKIKFITTSELKKFTGIADYNVIHDPEEILSSYKNSYLI